ncbi:MAG TPA: hypothetical protein VLI40_01910, partial [Gemmatimonadaceae bacterium]|nr:hypothetical protein [Gemmatimonadaceae bacterium]
MIDIANSGNIWLTEGIANLTNASKTALFSRATTPDDSIAVTTARLLKEVRVHGDRALSRMAKDFDGVELTAVEVARP